MKLILAIKDQGSLVRGDKTHSYEKIMCNAKQYLISADNECYWSSEKGQITFRQINEAIFHGECDILVEYAN